MPVHSAKASAGATIQLDLKPYETRLISIQ